MKKDIYYTSAPLPFIGQKRMFIKHFKKILLENIPGDGDGWTIVDVFGGSGLLSHVAKRLKPKARVIYNDFDGYSERLKNINDINRLRKLIENEIKGIKKGSRLSKEIKNNIIKVIDKFNGYKDTHILCSWLLFSGNQVKSLEDLYKKTFWQCLKINDYPDASNYLDGIEITNEAFHTLIPKFKEQKHTLLLLDPPYLCTAQASYQNKNYFDLIDFLNLINLTQAPFIFFSSTKSEFVRFLNWLIENKGQNWEEFVDTKKITVKAIANYCVKYEDNLIFKF